MSHAAEARMYARRTVPTVVDTSRTASISSPRSSSMRRYHWSSNSFTCRLRCAGCDEPVSASGNSWPVATDLLREFRKGEAVACFPPMLGSSSAASTRKLAICCCSLSKVPVTSYTMKQSFLQVPWYVRDMLDMLKMGRWGDAIATDHTRTRCGCTCFLHPASTEASLARTTV